MNSTLPSLNGGMEHRASDAHTEMSDGPPDPPSTNGAAICELLHASLPTVKEEENTGSTSGTLAGSSSLRASFSQLQIPGSSTPVQGANAPAEMQQHPETMSKTQAERVADALQPQDPLQSKFSTFGASYMTASPVQSICQAAPVTGSGGVAAPGSQQESLAHSVGLITSMSGPPSGILLTGMSTIGPVSSMLSGPVSTTTAGLFPLSCL